MYTTCVYVLYIFSRVLCIKKSKQHWKEKCIPRLLERFKNIYMNVYIKI